MIVRLVQMANEVSPEEITKNLPQEFLKAIKGQPDNVLIGGMEIDSEKETAKFRSGLTIWRKFFEEAHGHN